MAEEAVTDLQVRGDSNQRVWSHCARRHELQHFVGVMEGYITNQVFYLSWRELVQDLDSKVCPPCLSPPRGISVLRSTV